MRYLILLLFVIFALSTTVAGERNKSSCNDTEINQQWEKAVAAYPRDRLIAKLSTTRTGLCNLVKSGQLDVETARSIWEKALATTLLDRAKEEQQQRGLLRLFATF